MSFSQNASVLFLVLQHAPHADSFILSTSGISDFFLIWAGTKIPASHGEQLFSRTLTLNGLIKYMGRGQEQSSQVHKKLGLLVVVPIGTSSFSF